jgi:hypothetical protein
MGDLQVHACWRCPLLQGRREAVRANLGSRCGAREDVGRTVCARCGAVVLGVLLPHAVQGAQVQEDAVGESALLTYLLFEYYSILQYYTQQYTPNY